MKRLIILWFFLAYASYSNGQLFEINGNQEAFLQGEYMEVGISSCGSFGTIQDFSDSGSHARTVGNFLGLGFVADPDKDGWNVGDPDYHGDFFVPGTPVEGWGVHAATKDDTSEYINTNDGSICGSMSIPGSLTDYSASENSISATWQSASSFNGKVSVCQNVSMNVDATFFVVTVRLTNTTEDTLKELYYARGVDPDNDVTLSNDYSTENKTIMSESGSESIVTSRGTEYDDIFLGLGAQSSNARAAIKQSDIYFDRSSIKDIWYASEEYSRQPLTADRATGLSFRFTDIPPGHSKRLSFSYVLNVDDLDKGINSTDDEINILANGENITDSKTVTVTKGENLNMEILGHPSISWTWEPSEGGPELHGNSNTLRPLKDISYTLTGAYATGCSEEVKELSFDVNVIVDSCKECVSSFSPKPGKKYVLSAWVKEEYLGNSDQSDQNNFPLTYKHSGVRLSFNDGDTTLPLMRPSGPIVEGWQRIETPFRVPGNANNISVELVNDGAPGNVYFDDIRIHPFRSNMKSFVYDPSTQRLRAELDENNYATYYEYDDEGQLIRIRKETERGLKTIQESRQNQSKVHIEDNHQ